MNIVLGSLSDLWHGIIGTICTFRKEFTMTSRVQLSHITIELKLCNLKPDYIGIVLTTFIKVGDGERPEYLIDDGYILCYSQKPLQCNEDELFHALKDNEELKTIFNERSTWFSNRIQNLRLRWAPLCTTWHPLTLEYTSNRVYLKESFKLLVDEIENEFHRR